MPDLLASLHRIRAHARRQTGLQLRLAEEQLDRQRARLDEIERALAEARDSADPNSVLELSSWHTWRLREEMVLRREVARLNQRERDEATARSTHTGSVRDELSVDSLRQARTAEVDVTVRRADLAGMDEIAARIHWRAA